MALKYLKISLLKGLAKELAFKAGLLYLSFQDLIGARKIVNKFK